MGTIATTLLALLILGAPWAGAVAQPADNPSQAQVGQSSPDSSSSPAEATPSASPKTVEQTRLLGMRASTLVLAAAAIVFVIVLAAAFLSRDERPYRRSHIDPRL